MQPPRSEATEVTAKPAKSSATAGRADERHAARAVPDFCYAAVRLTAGFLHGSAAGNVEAPPCERGFL